jgi:hypothetical protein
MALAGDLEFCWVTLDRGSAMKKLNTHSLYILGQRVHALASVEHKEGMTASSNEIFLVLIRARITIQAQIKGEFFSTSLKRSAGAVLRAMHALGFEDDESPTTNVKEEIVIQPFHITMLTQRAKEFETVLANELPGLATYAVSPKGIFSTDDLITSAELQIPESLRGVLNPKACADIQQAGKCLAFELPTASAFHMWRAVESVMDSYHEDLTGKTFAAAGVTRNWGTYIKTLEAATAEKKITTFLDHIREEYRNPISHPDEMLELDEAFTLFGPALSVIGQMLKSIMENRNKNAVIKSLGTAAKAGTN